MKCSWIVIICIPLCMNPVCAGMFDKAGWKKFKKQHAKVVVKHVERDVMGVTKTMKKNVNNPHCNGALKNIAHSSDPCCINPNLPVCGEIKQ